MKCNLSVTGPGNQFLPLSYWGNGKLQQWFHFSSFDRTSDTLLWTLSQTGVIGCWRSHLELSGTE